jgi:hypothetical protein
VLKCPLWASCGASFCLCGLKLYYRSPFISAYFAG